MAVLRRHVKGRQTVFINRINVGTVRVQKRDSAGVAVLSSAVHGRAAERVGSRNIGPALDQEENNLFFFVGKTIHYNLAILI